MNIREINDLIDIFVSGSDISIAFANKIEVSLDEAFPEDDFIQETVGVLSMYRPGGGEFLFDVTTAREQLIKTKKYLELR